MITASMTTLPQKILAETHTSAVEMPVFLSLRCAEERFNDSACHSFPLNLFFQNETLTLKEKIDFSSIVTTCLNYDRNPGLICGENCLRNSLWCRGDYSLSCEGQFMTNNQKLCGNATVWINQTCDQFYNTGDKAALGHRCQGGAQHCYYPWYVSGNYYYEVSEQLMNHVYVYLSSEQ